jgi:hypothetical protein
MMFIDFVGVALYSRARVGEGGEFSSLSVTEGVHL